MPYVPGPFKLQDESNVGTAADSYNFTQDVIDQLSELDTIGGGWDSLLIGLGNVGLEPLDPFPEIDLNAAMDLVNVYSQATLIPEFLDVLSSIGEADQGLANAIAFAPAEAWQDAPAPFVAPLPAQILSIPEIPPDLINFNVTGAVGGGPQGPGPTGTIPGATVSLNNITAFGNANFTLGDTIQVIVTGGVGLPVRMQAWLNGVDLGMSDLGVIGGDGTWTFTGQLGPEAVGVWTEDWWVGLGKTASFNFVVLDA